MSRDFRAVATGLLIIFVAAAIRFAASLDDLWLDEIWTWALVQLRVRSVWDVLFTLKHENNHFLNTWWVYWLGPDADAVWYRLPGVILGSVTVLLGRQCVARDGRMAVLAASLLMIPSFLLVQYSSEARGYAYQLCFSLAAYSLLAQILRETDGSLSTSYRWIQRALFAASCILGCLGHPAFLMMFIAQAIWAATALVRRHGFPAAVLGWLSLFAIPGLALSWLWVINLSQLENGGGPIVPLGQVVVATLSLIVGGPERGVIAIAVALAVAIAVTSQLWAQLRSGDDAWVCTVAMVLVPAVLLVVLQREEVYVRYFLGTVILLQVALAQFLARCAQRGSGWRFGVTLILFATVVGNALHVMPLIVQGRGRGHAVVQFLKGDSGPGTIVVGTDHPFRHGILLQYFGRRVGISDRLEICDEHSWPAEGPEWFLQHSLDHTPSVEVDLKDSQGNRYELRRAFPYAGLSGWNTFVYERVAADTGSWDAADQR